MSGVTAYLFNVLMCCKMQKAVKFGVHRLIV